MIDSNVCLIGHRGTGKTSFLSRAAARDPHLAAHDLDACVARDAGRPVAEIFAREGEDSFRAREARVLEHLLDQPGRKVIAIGAGYAGPRPAAFTIWLRRETDRAGRCFLNRPRLDPAVGPLAEYLSRFTAREELYRAWADVTLTLPEGYDGGLESIVDGRLDVPFDLTLPAGVDVARFIARRAGWGLRRFEARDDLVDLGLVPDSDRVLRAYRRPGARPLGVNAEDWAIELGPAPRATAITSAHQGTVADAARRLDAGEGVAKLAVEVASFTELMEGHRWWRAMPTRRAFLPRSADGRWAWYRSLFGPLMPVHFVREGAGSAPDQLPLWQAVLQTPLRHAFAAVLGSPVAHSRTPMEHRAYFAARAMPVVAIDVSEAEWDEAWPILREFGLTHAAVTAPLKTRAYDVATSRDPAAARTGAANTLVVGDRSIHAANTDLPALSAWRDELPPFERPWLWGGGGVKSSVRAAWPGVREVSARAGVGADEASSPDLLIWAVGRARTPELPPAFVRPRLVLDLNYADDSPGLEFAVARGLNYASGLRMFELQAAAQRAFWTSVEGASRARQLDR